jgi:diguanylate cyclase (GGDEF)-like protein
VARFGGEEIGIVLTQTDLPGAIEVAERLRQQVAAFSHTLGDKTIQKTASFGIASFDGAGTPVSAQQFVQRVDQALYRAKKNGRNQVVTWSPELSPGEVESSLSSG